MQSRLKFILAAAGTALLLAGCGGGGSSDTAQAPVVEPTPEPAPEPTAAEMKQAYDDAVAAAAAAMTAYDDAKAAQTAATTEAEKRAADAAVGTAAAALTVAEAAATAAKEAWKTADPTGYALAEAEKKIAEFEAAQAAEKKAAEDAAAEEQKKADAAEEEQKKADEAATALAAQVTQIDADEDMMVTPSRDSQGNIVGIMVGETEVSVVRHAHKKADLDTPGAGAVGFGVVVENEGIQVSYAESHANMTASTVAKTKEVTDDVFHVLVAPLPSDLSVDDGAELPLGATKVTLVPHEDKTGGAAVAFLLDTNGDAATSGDTVVWTLPVKGGIDRYFIQVGAKPDPDGAGALGRPQYASVGSADVNYPLVVELDVVTTNGPAVRAKEASAYDHVAFGAWAEIGENKKLAGLGNGYLIADPNEMTPASAIPVTGSATFEGQYVSYIKRKGASGNISLQSGDAEMTANFGRESMEVKLEDQFGEGNDLTLTGSINGSTFEGTGLKDFSDGDLLSDGATAKMQGAFYGPKVDEVGGVYDVLGGSKKNPGRVVGAFGGVNTDN